MKNYWFVLDNNVYVSYGDEGMLLYHTVNGELLETREKLFIELIQKAQEKSNLGAFKLSVEQLNDEFVMCFIRQIIMKDMGRLEEVADTDGRPISLLPILNLLSDIRKINSNSERMIGENVMLNLSSLNLFVNSTCSNNCVHCSVYCNQVMCCTKREGAEELPENELKSILDQVKGSSVGKINVLGGNILKYTYLSSLLKIAPEFNIDICYWLHYMHFQEKEVATFIDLLINKCIIVNFPLNRDAFDAMLRYVDSTVAFFYFIVENEEQLAEIDLIIEKCSINSYRILPFFNGINLDLFENNVFHSKTDLFLHVKGFREIFCNEVVNSNFFGTMYILPNGEIKSNLMCDALGNISNMNMMEAVTEEIKGESAWRRVRDKEPCLSCLYKYLCPPISNYELAIGKLNLCLIKR